MAEAKLAMSLDALIAQASTKRSERKPRAEKPKSAPAQSGPRKGLQGNKPKKSSGAGNGNAQPQQQPKQKAQPQQQQQAPRKQQQNNRGANLGVRGGNVQKRAVLEVPAHVLRSGPGGPPPARKLAPYQQRQPAPEGRWQHDMYRDEAPAPRRAPLSQAAPLQPKLVIRNLHHNVSTADLLELFSTMGTVVKHGLNFDNSGRSLGTGYVVFETREEAERAKAEYDGVALDGQSMAIYLAEEAGAGGITQLSSGIRVHKPAGNGLDGGAGAGGRGGPLGGRVGPGNGAAGGGGGRARQGGGLAAAALRETATASRPARTGGMGARGGRGGRLRSAVVPQAQLDRELDDYMQE